MFNQKKVLIIEDDADIREAMSELLSIEGFLVETAINGQQGLELLREGLLPDLILLDLMMPVMDGFHFRKVQEADETFVKIPVVIMTADGHIDEKKMKIGAKDAIKKPLDIDAALAVIRKYTDAS